MLWFCYSFVTVWPILLKGIIKYWFRSFRMWQQVYCKVLEMLTQDHKILFFCHLGRKSWHTSMNKFSFSRAAWELVFHLKLLSERLFKLTCREFSSLSFPVTEEFKPVLEFKRVYTAYIRQIFAPFPWQIFAFVSVCLSDVRELVFVCASFVYNPVLFACCVVR